MRMDRQPMTTSASPMFTRMAFSPVPPRLARAFIMFMVATELVPRATISTPRQLASQLEDDLVADGATHAVDDRDDHGWRSP